MEKVVLTKVYHNLNNVKQNTWFLIWSLQDILKFRNQYLSTFNGNLELSLLHGELCGMFNFISKF